MSWYLANEDGVIGQFATSGGLTDLRIAVDHGTYPALKKFIDSGITVNTLLCVYQLGKLRKMTLHDSVKDTAKALQGLLRGQRLVSITQGMTGYDGDTEQTPKAKESALKAKESALKEAAKPGRALNHPDHARLIDPIKKRVKKILAGYFRRQEKAIVEDVRLRFHVGKEYRESLRKKHAADGLTLQEADTPGDKRAMELLPESLSPLDFLTTPKEDSDYLAQVRLAIERAEKQLAAELETPSAKIGPNATTQYLEDHSLSKLTGDFSDTTKQRLRSAIADAVDEGGTADDIVAAIQDVMEDFSTRRSELVAQTEVNDAFNFARHEVADSAGMTEKAWVTESGNPCEDCEANADQEWIDITEPFEGGVMYPTQHPMCMCSCNYRLVTSGEGK